MGASYDLTKDLQFKASAGANYGAPAFDAFPAYQQNASTFLAKGITADQLWHSIKPETSANIDVGLRWTYATAGFGKGSIEPTLYYSRSHNKDVVYDPGIGVQYGQNVGESQAYGAQFMAHWLPVENLDIFTTVSYDRDVFTANLPVLAGSSTTAYANAAVKGSQLPDVPEWTAALGANWRYGDFTVAPILRFISDRYGDTSRTQLLSGYATVDVNFNYEFKTPCATFDASLSVTNLFNASYIGFVNNGYYQQSSGTNAFYYPGAPRAIMGKISVRI
jgi:iron complex outermembrane receptor protein